MRIPPLPVRDFSHDFPGDQTSRYGLGLLVLGAIAGYFLVAEHRAHLLGALPFLLLLACPLMHIFMHRGHGAGHHHSSHGAPTQQPPAPGEQP